MTDAQGQAMTDASISVLLVDDHAVVREGYRRLLDVSGNFRSGKAPAPFMPFACEASQADQQRKRATNNDRAGEK